MKRKRDKSKWCSVALILCLLHSFYGISQENVRVRIPEAYELSNIILALTDYGISDEWEVQKNSSYYKEILAFFEPVKNHPLLKKTNYSRQLWENYLSFRTDAVAFSFEGSELKRNYKFHAVAGHMEFDRNLELINDFIKQSHFRTFYKDHKSFYDSIAGNYINYYMIDEVMTFLRKEFGGEFSYDKKAEHQVILSPLVGRMNCHREIGDSIIAEFPTTAPFLINGTGSGKPGDNERAVEIHTLFTEMDHDIVNRLSDKYKKLLNKSINYRKWDDGSGYKNANVFNEYMTWALYDVFTLKYFPTISDSVNTQWHYQNGERGFFASSVFAEKLCGLFKSKRNNETLADLYPGMIAWCSEFQKDLSFPVIISPVKPLTSRLLSRVKVEIVFSEPMKEIRNFDLNIITLKEGRKITSNLKLTPEANEITWTDNGKTLTFFTNLNPATKIIFQANWWGCKTPLVSKKGVMLRVFSKVEFAEIN